jgi:glutathione S-transferase
MNDNLVLDDGMVLYDSPVICEYLDALDGDPRLFPRHGRERITALRRQALGDGLLDLLVLARNERMRAKPSQAHLTSSATRTATTLDHLERDTDALAASPFSIGHIAIGCALSYLDFRFAEQDWRRDHPRLADWHALFAERPSVQATLPLDDS